jgi:hypothetical protein
VLLGPIAVFLLIGFAPGISQRFLQGISYDKKGEALTGGRTDLYTVTAGRSVLWPYVLESIAENPVFGYGREAMNRNGVGERVFRATGEVFDHPHNGYFQLALDNGAVGLTIFLVFFVALLVKSGALFRGDDPQATAAGGMAFALLSSLLIAAVGAQTFYPTELSLGLWSAIGLLMRVSVQQSRAQVAPEAVPHSGVARITNAPRVRWRATRLDRHSAVPSRARLSWATSRPRNGARWKARQRR